MTRINNWLTVVMVWLLRRVEPVDERGGGRNTDEGFHIAAGAGQDGAAVVDTLLKRAESLRDELLADEHAGAHRASGQMSTPGALQVFLIATWVLYPAAVALLSF